MIGKVAHVESTREDLALGKTTRSEPGLAASEGTGEPPQVETESEQTDLPRVGEEASSCRTNKWVNIAGGLTAPDTKE